MDFEGKDRCGYTVGTCLRETMEQLEVWRREAKKHERTLHAALSGADALAMLWARLDESTRSALDADIQIREKLRGLIGFYGF